MFNRRRTPQVRQSLIQNVRYPLPLKLITKKRKGFNKVKKIISLLFAILFIPLLLKGLSIWKNNAEDNMMSSDKGINPK